MKHVYCTGCGQSYTFFGEFWDNTRGFTCEDCGTWNGFRDYTGDKTYVETICRDCGLVLKWSDDGPRVSVGLDLCSNCSRHRKAEYECSKGMKSSNELRLDAVEEVQNLHARALDEHEIRISNMEQPGTKVMPGDAVRVKEPAGLKPSLRKESGWHYGHCTSLSHSLGSIVVNVVTLEGKAFYNMNPQYVGLVERGRYL